MPPATTRSRPPRAPLTGLLWLGARFTLAMRRTRRFQRWWLSIGGVGTVLALLVPVATRTPTDALVAAVDAAVADSVRSADALARARARVASADSLAATMPAATGVAPVTAPPVTPGTSPGATLAEAIETARDGRRREAVLALAAHPALTLGPRLRATIDSFRVARDPVQTARLAGTIIAMADYQARTRGGTTAAPRAPTVAPPPTRASRADTALQAIVRAERDSLQLAERRHEANRAAVAAAVGALAAARADVPLVSPGLAMLAVVLLGLFARLGLALLQELREPTIAHPLEAERAVGAPVLAWVRDGLPEGPLRFRPSGVDPFRVLYLHLTSTGTRARDVIVTGDDLTIVTAVAARLAIAAAADHRTTLVAEWDTEQVALARIFRDQPEPGVSDAMAGAFAWREVARSVGSSDGLSIAMLPAGTTRGTIDVTRRTAALEEFQRFRGGFEFSIISVALRDLADARALVPGAPTILCASLGETAVADLVRHTEAAEAGAEHLHSLVLWDAPRPVLLSRAELAAWLSKRKGRTPGGSFKAVQDAIKEPPTNQ